MSTKADTSSDRQSLPVYSPITRRNRGNPLTVRLILLGIFAFALLHTASYIHISPSRSSKIPIHASETLKKCHHLHTKPGPPPDFNLRTESDRFTPGTRATLLRNATIWTGRVKGLEVLEGDILLDKGLIKAVGKIDTKVLNLYTDLVTVDVNGAWVTPGYEFVMIYVFMWLIPFVL